MVASAKSCFVLLCCNRHLSAARAEMFSKFVCQGMEAHVLHGMNLFHVWKFMRRASLSCLWIGASRMRPTQ